MSRWKYVIISPVRDEAEFLQRTIDSVVAQSVRPALWIIVDDGSTDDTPGVVARASRQHGWIRLHCRSDRGVRKVGGGVVEALCDGLSEVNLSDYDYICKLDGDLELGPTYFEHLFERLGSDPALGTASGKCWERTRAGWTLLRTGDDFSLGACKTYRCECFQQIGGFVREVMWDGIDCHRCRMLGWKAASFHDDELKIRHLRWMGSSFRSIYHGRRRWGYGQYFMGTHPLYALAVGVYRMFDRPWILGGLSILAGYVEGYVKRMPRYPDLEFRRFLRQWQLARLGLARGPVAQKRQQASGMLFPSRSDPCTTDH